MISLLFALLRAGWLLETGLGALFCDGLDPLLAHPILISLLFSPSAFLHNAITARAYRSDCLLCYPSIARDRSPWDSPRLHVPRLSRVLGGCHKSQPNGPERSPFSLFSTSTIVRGESL
jgi:hypothetical protein